MIEAGSRRLNPLELFRVDNRLPIDRDFCMAAENVGFENVVWNLILRRNNDFKIFFGSRTDLLNVRVAKWKACYDRFSSHLSRVFL